MCFLPTTEAVANAAIECLAPMHFCAKWYIIRNRLWGPYYTTTYYYYCYYYQRLLKYCWMLSLIVSVISLYYHRVQGSSNRLWTQTSRYIFGCGGGTGHTGNSANMDPIHQARCRPLPLKQTNKYERHMRKLPLLQGQKSTPNPTCTFFVAKA